MLLSYTTSLRQTITELNANLSTHVMKAKAYSTLQKTYDQSHLICSTAVYYESQGNNDEALRCWRECLSQLHGYNTGGYRPCTETERTLLQSLKMMQDQCQERVDVLQAILMSKEELKNNQWWNTGNPEETDSIKPSSTNVLEFPISPPIPPRLPESPYTPQASAVSSSSSFEVHTTRGSHLARAIPLVSIPRLSRAPSPEKRAFLSTLRSAKKERNNEASPKSEGVTAVKAAALAWSSLSRTEAETLSRTLSTPSADIVDHTRKNDRASTSTLDPHNSLQTSITSSQQCILPSLVSPKKKHRPQGTILPFGNSDQLCFNSVPPPPPPHQYSLGRSLASSHESTVGLRATHTSKSYYPIGLDLSTPTAITERNPVKPIVEHSLPTNLNSPLPRKPVHTIMQMMAATEKDTRSQQYARALKKDPYQNGYHQFGQVAGPGNDSYNAEDIFQRTTFQNALSTGQSNRIINALKEVGKRVDKQAALQLANEIVSQGDEVRWDDIAGLDTAKLALKEAVVYPFLRPDLFSGLREPARGILLFGPPGTGKTMIARAVATESKSTFFSISASSLTSKYLGESEKLVRALFALAKALAPSIIFVDEIDSLLSSRSGSGEHEATRRIKTEFLIQWSDLTRAAAGKDTEVGDASRVLVLAATNLPWAIDDAARRRFVRRQYIPLPEGPTRKNQLLRLLSHQKYQINYEEMEDLVRLTDGFSGSDLTALAKDAAMGPLRSLGEALLQIQKDDIRPITFSDFKASLASIRPSVSKEGLQAFEDWAESYGERV